MIRYLLKAINHPFSIKKSVEQLAYHESRQKMLPNFYYQSFHTTISIQNFIQKHQAKKQQQKQINTTEIVSGRISAIRKHGKTTFIDIREGHLKLQIVIKNIDTQDQTQFPFRRGDIIGVQGNSYITQKGELSIIPISKQHIRMISPCLWMLPQYGALKDSQTRHRNKHLDLITNSQSMRTLKLRSKILQQLRCQLSTQNFIEVETPILSLSCGGAIAKPFVTYHNDHKMNLFMRIAPELYLKQLLVGGLQKVFQIGKNFRNQSIDQTHNPEFTSCELYVAYSNYIQMIGFTKKLILNLARKTINQTKVKVGTHEIQLDQEWKTVDFIKGLEEEAHTQFPKQFQSQQSLLFLKHLCQKHGVMCDQPKTASRLLDKLAGHFLEPYSLKQPLVILNHPRVLSPLAKPLKEEPHKTERFELFIGGWEIVNSYSQLNNPMIQKENTPQDFEFVEALEYGLMPCAGWGIGLDRLIMLFSGCDKIQDVIIFPLLKERQVEKQ